LLKNPKVRVAIFLFLTVNFLANGILIFRRNSSGPVLLFCGLYLIGALGSLQLAWHSYRKIDGKGKSSKESWDSGEGGEFMIRNQLFLKKPWSFTVITVAGAFFGLLYANASRFTFSFTTNAAMFITIVAVLNTLFFFALRRTRQRTPPKS
jgi:hypothetical protein